MYRIAFLLAVVLMAQVVASPALAEQNELTAQEHEQGWILLFDGKTTNGWLATILEAGSPAAGWQAPSILRPAGRTACGVHDARSGFRGTVPLLSADFSKEGARLPEG